MGFMSDDEKYDPYPNMYKITTKLTEWIWNQENLEKDESWHDLLFGEACIKIWELINVS